MHRVYRQLILALFSIISVAIACNTCQQNQQRKRARETWGPQLDQQVYDIFYMQSARLTTNDDERKQFADCCLAKMKELFPNGIADIGTQMSDSVKVAVMKMGAGCSMVIKSPITVWSPELMQQLKLQFYSYAETKLLPDDAKKEYVDCLAFKITTEYPNGISGVQKDSLKKTITKARESCLKLVANKYQKLKHKNLKPEVESR